MKHSENLHQLKELQSDWRRQDFHLTGEQQQRYDKLLELRRQRVLQLYADKRVFKGKSNVE